MSLHTLAVSSPPVTPQVEMLDVVHMPLARARNAIEQALLTVEFDRRFSHQDPGTVIRQSVSAGSQIDQGSTVMLVVAKPFPMVPSVAGQLQKAAMRTLEKKGYVVIVVQSFSSLQKGTILTMSPSGSAARWGTRPCG